MKRFADLIREISGAKVQTIAIDKSPDAAHQESLGKTLSEWQGFGAIKATQKALLAPDRKKSVKISGSCPAGHYHFATSRKYRLIPGRRYRLSGLMYVETMSSENTSAFKCELFQKEVWIENIFSTYYVMGKKGSWQQLTAEFEAPRTQKPSLSISIEKLPSDSDVEVALYIADMVLETIDVVKPAEPQHGLNPLAKSPIIPATASGPFDSSCAPFCSIIIPMYNAQSTLSLCLDSISKLDYPKDKLEIIVIDNGSTDQSCNVAKEFGVTLLSETSVQSSYASRNKGIKTAKGELIVFTDSDCIVTTDWLRNLVQKWDDKSIGCFAGEIMSYRPETIIETFADDEGILRQGSTLSNSYLPYVQTANAAYRREVLDRIGFFKPEMTSGGDADLAWRMQKQLGLRIEFVPEALVFHKHRTTFKGLYRQFNKYEYGQHFLQKLYPDLPQKSMSQRKGDLDRSIAKTKLAFFGNLRFFLDGRIDSVELLTPLLFSIIALGRYDARKALSRRKNLPDEQNMPGGKNILVIAPRLPEFDRASGDLRLYRILQILRQDHNVFYLNDGMWERFLRRGERKYLNALIDMGITVLQSESEFGEVSENRKFHAVVCEFYHLGQKYRPMISKYAPGASFIIDSVDVHFLRERMMAETLQDEKLMATSLKTRKDELSAYAMADTVWVVSTLDRDTLMEGGIPGSKIHIVPNIHTVAETAPPLSLRDNNTILFVGGFVHQPNVDAIEYFYTKIFPLVKEKLPGVTLLIVGDTPPESIQEMASADVKVLGFVPDTQPYLDQAVISIAPLRYGAGLKGKVGEAMAAGLPLVTSSIGAQGMDLVSGKDCFIADQPADFADSIVKLLTDRDLWQLFSTNGRAFMQNKFGYEKVKEELSGFFNYTVPSLAITACGTSPRVSIAYLTKNGGNLFRKSLEAILSQETDFRFEVIAVDSGSTDGTLELLSKYSVKCTQIPASDFNFGLTRDLAFSLATGEIVVVISQDAIPIGTDWLQKLVAPFSTPETALVQGRDIPNPEIDLFFWDQVHLFYNTRDVKKWMKAYDNIGVSFTCCAIRRSVWEANPLGKVEMSEDKVFQKRIVGKGHAIVSLQSAQNHHSHAYNLRDLANRCENEGLGWRTVDIRYSMADMIIDILNPIIIGALLTGIFTLKIRSLAEFLFPVIRPYYIYKGNNFTSGYVK